MSALTMALENISNEPQHVFAEDGTRHTIPAAAVSVRPLPVAELFLRNRSRYIRRYEAFKVPHIYGEKQVWVANMTGNPATPETVEVPQTDRKTGLTTWTKRPHPLKQPQEVKYRMQLGQEPGFDQEGKETAFNLTPVRIRFPAGKRYPVSERYARWMLQRDAMQEDGHTGKIAECRAPTDFEPTEEPSEFWTYDKIRIYIGLMGDQVKIDLKKDFPPASQVRGNIDEMREKLYHALFFYLVNEEYELPNKAAFNLAMDEYSKVVASKGK